MVQVFTIPVALPGANQLRELGPFAYNTAKKRWGGVVALYARQAGLKPVKGPTYFRFHFLEKDRTRDPDNFASAGMKIILDALQEVGVLPNDGWKWVSGISLTWEVSKTPGVGVTMKAEE